MHFDLIIVGAGLAGSSLAVALQGSGRRIALVEGRAPTRPTGWDSRVYALSPGSLRFLDRLGVTARLDTTRIAPVYDMRIAGDAGGRLHFSAYECGVDRLASIAESSLIGLELWETARRQANLNLFCPARPSALRVDAEQVTLTLADGQTLHAPLLAAADGGDSWVRQTVGLDSQVSAYDELGVVANFACQREHHGTAWQWFREDGVLAWLPLPGNRISMVWSAPRAVGLELLALPPAELASRVAAAGENTLGELQMITPAAAFPLRLLTVPQIIAPRVALLGDAAHGIHPLSGHGINLGFNDAQALADIVLATPAVADLGEPLLLRRYQRQRKEEIFLLQQGTHALHELFRQPSPALAWLRNRGLDLTDRLGPVKSMFARYAMS
jgi:2-polyprenylphenol 6-hydroxylase